MGEGLATGLPRDRGTRWGQAITVLRELYFGFTPMSRRFRFTVLAFDVVTISYFVTTTVTGTAERFQELDVAIGVVLMLDLIARTLATRRSVRQLASVTFYIDLVVIVALFGSAVVPNLDFARVLRLLRVLRSYRLLVELRRDFSWFRRHEDVVEAFVNLTVFVFVTTSLVFVVEGPRNASITTFMDALYFTIATLTTTGFGDVVPTDGAGRMLAVVIMVFGVGLFLRLIQTLFRPNKVAVECQSCGLERHDLDAVHCKHCGEVINIASEGAV
ncbi:potassium channel family protein [Acuticoccus sp.]|uniref:potassium channel family protein n=1 Tax=Acuticoccus sp. TaxID=1904378 RepID=UPI003B5215F1